MVRRALAVFAACFSFIGAFAQTITTGTISPTTYCAGISITVPFTSVGSYGAGNIYTAELSNSTGGFPGTPLGTLASSANSGSISGTIPFSIMASGSYKVRVTSSSPISTSTQSVSTLTIHAPGLNPPAFSGTTFCQGASVTISYTVTSGCVFSNTPSANVFTAELSDNLGSFSAATSIGTNTSNTSGTISAVIPIGTPGGNGYRIRVKSSNGGVISASNSSGALTINVITLNAPTTGSSTFCVGASFNVQYTLTNPSCPFTAGNVFTAQLSNATGSFASPQTIGTVTATTAGNIPVTIPINQTAGTGYRFRVLASGPGVTSPTSVTDVTINQFGIAAPTLSATSLCQGSAVNVTFNVLNSCNFPNTPSNNVFTAQLSNSSGSFASPTNIGNVTTSTGTTFGAVIPATTTAGSGYRIRVVSSNPSVVLGPDNGSNISITAASGTPTVFGTTAWNAYVYSGTAFPITNNLFLGTYTENNLGFNTTSRWAPASGPGVADATTGSAYTGCAVPVTSYSMSLKRTNFTCGYYQIDVNNHDDDVRVFLGGTLIFSHVGGCCDNHTNIYTGFLGPSSQLEFQLINHGGQGSLQVTVSTATNPIIVSPTSTTICSTASASLLATGTTGMTFAWTPTTGLTPSNGIGASMSALPGATTTYTVTGTDPATGCTQTKTSVVNVVSPATIPTLSITNPNPTICSPVTTSALNVSGANTYTWTPTIGLTPSSGIGATVIANPSSTITYTVTGNTGCQTNTNTATVTVQTVPSTPTTTFGNNLWNVFAHNNTTVSNYYGFYQESSLSFNTTSKWAPGNGPSIGNAAYSGCTLGSTTSYSLSFKRTNFTCGYYQMDVNYQDDQFKMLVNGVQVFQNNSFTTTTQTNVWSGFLGPSSTVELQLVNTTSLGQLQITFGLAASGPQTLGPNVTICAGTTTNLSASATAYPSATYNWSASPSTPNITFSPGSNQANTTLQTAVATTNAAYTLTNTITDAGATGCTATKSLIVNVNPTPATAVTPTNATIICPTQSVTLTATGANTYSWSPAAGLSAVTGNIVTAQPTATTTYTVTGDNNCTTNTAQSVITVIPLPDYATVYPTNTWNIYGFNSTTYGTNYQGYYTDNGTGSPAYSFNSITRYGATSAPSTVNSTGGNIWAGCTMPATNYVLSAKRSGFACGTYQIDIPGHDDYFTLYINGAKVAEHLGCCDSHTNVWTGVLTATSTIDYQLTNLSGNGFFSITLTQMAQPAGQVTWIGATSTDWFTTSNWCNAVPTGTNDVVITAAGTAFQPTIGAAGAAVRSITINGAVAATSVSPAVPAARLTMDSFNLDVNNNWTNNGTFVAETGTVSFVGSGSNSTIIGATTFKNIVIDKTNGVTIPSSTTQQVNGTMTLTNGVVTQNGTLRFNNGSTVSGGSNSTYVDGIVTKVGNTDFTFPLGKSGFYFPAGITAPTTGSDTYTAQYVNTSPLPTHPNASRSVTLDHVNNVEYWNVNRTAGSSTVKVTLGWNVNSSVDNLTQLSVVNWNGSFWSDLGNSATTGNSGQGTVTATTAASAYGIFSLASTSIGNALPVALADLQCGLNSIGNPEIDWITTSEINGDHFSVERSDDGRNFETISRIISKGDSNDEQKYSFEDEGAPNGQLYYRLKQVDRDGHVVSYEMCSMTVESAGLSIYPNPATGIAVIKLQSGRLQDLTVINTIGQNVNVPYAVKGSGVEIDVSTLPAGVYLVRVSAGNRFAILRLLKS